MAELCRVDVDDGVARLIIDAPPMNVMTVGLMFELAGTFEALDADPAVRVVVVSSAHPEFWIAHFDVAAILTFPTGPPPEGAPPNPFRAMCERLRTMPTPVICSIAGRVGGGGAELAASADMRFGARGRFVLNQMEVPLGLIPGGTGTQRIPRLVGPGRALEIVLGAVDIDADTAAAWGWLNRALDPDELDPWVDRLARRIASFPPEAVARAKRSVRNAETMPLDAALDAESRLFSETLREPETRRRMERFLALGGQTPDAERDIEGLTARLAEGDDPGPTDP